MYFDTMSSEEQVAYLIKPILKALKAAGGQMERSELRDSICESDDRIAEFAQVLTTSKYTGKHRLTRAHREKQLKMSCQALHNAPPNRT